MSSSCVVAVVTNNSNGPVSSNRNSILSDRIYGDNGSALDEEEILDMEDLMKNKSRSNVQIVPTDLGNEIAFHDIYDRKVTFYGEDNDDDEEVGDAKDNSNSSNSNNNNNHNTNCNGSNKTEKRKSTSSHSSFSSSTSSGIISANNDEFKIIMKNNYECTLLMMNNNGNDDGDDDDEDDDEEEETLAEETQQDEDEGVASYHRNGFTRKTGQSLTDDEFKTSFNGETDSGNDDPSSMFFSSKSFVNGDGLVTVTVAKDKKEDHLPKCMKLILDDEGIAESGM